MLTNEIVTKIVLKGKKKSKYTTCFLFVYTWPYKPFKQVGPGEKRQTNWYFVIQNYIIKQLLFFFLVEKTFIKQIKD